MWPEPDDKVSELPNCVARMCVCLSRASAVVALQSAKQDAYGASVGTGGRHCPFAAFPSPQ